MHRFKDHLTYANVVSTLCLFLLVGGGIAAASVIINSNGQVAQNTISGHKPPSGDHPNIIAGSVNATDLATGAATAGKIAPNSINSSKIIDGQVKNADFAYNSVTGANVLDGSLTGQDLQDHTITTDKVGQGFLTQQGGNRGLRYYAHEWYTPNTTNNNIAFGQVTLEPVAANQFKVCFNYIGSWGYGISIDGGGLTVNHPAGSCGSTHTVAAGGTFEINDGQDLIFGSGDPSTSGEYFVYGFYSP